MLVGHALAHGEVSDAVDLVLGGVSRIAVLRHQPLPTGSATVIGGDADCCPGVGALGRVPYWR